MQAIKKERDSNLELFRIITMILIIAHHYVVNSGLTGTNGLVYTAPLSLHSQFLLILGAWGKIGINCFVFITGYFMCKSNISAKKFAKLVFQILFYRIIIHTVFWVVGYDSFSLKKLILILIPIREIGTDFISTYLVFFLFIPFLNIFIRNINEIQHIKVILLCLFTYTFFGSFHKVTMNYVSWFIVLYLLSSYIRFYPKKVFFSKRIWGILMVISIILVVVSVTMSTVLMTKGKKIWPYYFVIDSNTFLALFTSLSSFMFFKNIKLKYNYYINLFGASTFGVLLIHANSSIMRKWLWKDFLDNMGAFYNGWGGMYMQYCQYCLYF